MRILTRLLLIRLMTKLLRGNSTVPVCSFNWFQFVVCFMIFMVHLIAYLMFNLSYLTEDHNHKSVTALASLVVNLLPMYNLAALAMRLLFTFGPKPRLAHTKALEFEPKEMTRSFLVQEVVLQSYYLLFVWFTRHRSIVQDAYGNLNWKVNVLQKNRILILITHSSSFRCRSGSRFLVGLRLQFLHSDWLFCFRSFRRHSGQFEQYQTREDLCFLKESSWISHLSYNVNVS